MATVTQIFERLPQWMQARYGSTYQINWINSLLEEISGEPKLFRTINIQTGAIVENEVWVDLPAGCRAINQIMNPGDHDQKYNFKIINSKIYLDGVVVYEMTDPDTASTFTNYETTHIDVDITDATEDEYKDFLFYITAGTYAGKGYILSGNDASAGGTCRLYFLHDLSTALDGTKVTAASLISEDYYVLIEHTASFDSVSAVGDEVPINDNYERRLTDAWIKWKVWQELDSSNKNTISAERDFENVLLKIKREIRSSVGGRVVPRDIPGLDQYKKDIYDMSLMEYEEEI